MSNNGRINIQGPTMNQFELFHNPGVSYNDDSFHDALTGNWNETSLSKAFFSGKNIQIIQNGIKAGVYSMSNTRFIVSDQDITNLKIIMRAIFLQYSANKPNHITEQIFALNKLVLDYCVPSVYKEAIAYIKYKNDVSTLAVPQARPIYVNNKGNKPNEYKHF